MDRLEEEPRPAEPGPGLSEPGVNQLPRDLLSAAFLPGRAQLGLREGTQAKGQAGSIVSGELRSYPSDRLSPWGPRRPLPVMSDMLLKDLGREGGERQELRFSGHLPHSHLLPLWHQKSCSPEQMQARPKVRVPGTGHSRHTAPLSSQGEKPTS